MIEHFNNLQTPLKSVHKYPLLADQRRRFESAGWTSTFARSLWDLWTDATIVPPQQKLSLNGIEPFDEWEEFVLFASHYFILVATNTSGEDHTLPYRAEAQQNKTSCVPGEKTSRDPPIFRSKHIPDVNKRRFGALFSISDNVLGHHAGLGSQARLGNVDFYGPPGHQIPHDFVVSGIEPRMCHTITAAGQDASLLVGGRASPTQALKDCWILCQQPYRVHDLPGGLYRHCATQIDFSQAGQSERGVLVYGGKTGEGLVSSSWLLWCNTFGWVKLQGPPSSLEPRFSAALTFTGPGTGLLIGGMDTHSKFLPEIWEWSILDGEEGLSMTVRRARVTVEVPASPKIQSIKCAQQEKPCFRLTDDVLGRMGACVVNSSQGIVLIGGVSARPMLRELEIVRLMNTSKDGDGTSVWSCLPLNIQADGQWPLLVGHAALSIRESVVILGGGATCFSFGTYWNQGLITLTATTDKTIDLVPLSIDRADPFLLPLQNEENLKTSKASAGAPTKVEDIKVESAQQFEHIVNRGYPVIIRQSQLGPCTTDWTLEGLKGKIGVDRDVSFRTRKFDV